MDKESIKIMNEIKKELDRICKENDRCTTCNIKHFKEKYDIKCDLCMRTFIAQYLLGDNEDAANFYKNEIENFRNMCEHTNCKDCEVARIRNESKKIDADCVIIYFAIKLLKDV